MAEPTETLEPLSAVDPPAHDDAGGYSRVTADQASAIIRLTRANPSITQREIAAAIGVKSASTVSYWLRRLNTDTTLEARKLMKSEALRAALKISEHVDHDDPRVSQGAAKAITALAGVQESAQAIQVGVQVVVGQPGAPAGPDPFDNVVVNSLPVSD
jgi:transcriptional regulator with XRE-family HTH domain